MALTPAEADFNPGVSRQRLHLTRASGMLPAIEESRTLCSLAGFTYSTQARLPLSMLVQDVSLCLALGGGSPKPPCRLLRLQVPAEGAQVRDIQLPWANGQIEAARRAFLDKHPNNKHKDQAQLAKGDGERAHHLVDDGCPETAIKGKAFKLSGLGPLAVCHCKVAVVHWRALLISFGRVLSVLSQQSLKQAAFATREC